MKRFSMMNCKKRAEEDSQATDHGIDPKASSIGDPSDAYRKSRVIIGLHGIQVKDARIYYPAGQLTQNIGAGPGGVNKYFSFFFVLFVLFVV